MSDSTYCLIDKLSIPVEKPIETPDDIEKIINSVIISGKVPMEQWTQLFPSFIQTLSQNNIEIEIKIKGKSTNAKPLTETSAEYKIIKESAKQLGLNFEEE